MDRAPVIREHERQRGTRRSPTAQRPDLDRRAAAAAARHRARRSRSPQRHQPRGRAPTGLARGRRRRSSCCRASATSRSCGWSCHRGPDARRAAARVGRAGVRRGRAGRRRGRPRGRRVGDAGVGRVVVADREPLGRDLPADERDQRGRARARRARASCSASAAATSARLWARAGGSSRSGRSHSSSLLPRLRRREPRIRPPRKDRRGARGASDLGARHRDRPRSAPNWRMIGAFAYLLCDIAVLWVCLRAVGISAPILPLIVGYQVGYLANLIPIPGRRRRARGRAARRAAPVRPARRADRGRRDPVPRDRAVGADARRHGSRSPACAADDCRRAALSGSRALPGPAIRGARRASSGEVARARARSPHRLPPRSITEGWWCVAEQPGLARVASRDSHWRPPRARARFPQRRRSPTFKPFKLGLYKVTVGLSGQASQNAVEAPWIELRVRRDNRAVRCSVDVI